MAARGGAVVQDTCAHAGAVSGVAAAASAVNPIGDASRLHRVVKVVAWVAAAVLVAALLELAGVDVSGWIAGLWDTLGSVSPKYLLAALALQTAVTSLN